MNHTTTEKNLANKPGEKLRVRAEKLLTAEGGAFDQISPAEVKNLVLELKMRQMQLEMQNEELQRAQEAITQARDRYADLYDFAPVGYFTLDRKGKIVEVNLAGAQLLGAERDRLVNQSSFRWVAPESREACRSHYRKVFDHHGPQTCEVKLRRRGGPPFYAALESVAAPGEAGVILHCRTAMSDITDRKRAEERLQRTSRALKALSACNQALVHATQEKGFLTDVCEVIVREGGYPLAWVGYAQPDEMKSVVPIASAGVGAGHSEWVNLTWGEDERGKSPGGMAIKTGKIQVARDILHDPALAPWHEEWRRREFKAIIALPLIIEGQVIGILDICAEDLEAFDPEEVRLLEELAGGVAFGIWSLRNDKERQRAEAQVQQSLEKLTKALDGTVLALANTVEMRDPYTAGHQRRVAQLAAAMAQEMGFPAERVEGMRVLGLLHDIGKIAVPAEILSKPGRLSSMEFKLIQDHPRVGYEIIKDIDFPFPLAEGILQHHERLNGSGYPQGLPGPDIIPEARILAVADVVEAMASHRPYRKALGLNQALEEISRNRGILYDPEVVDICLKLFLEKGFLFSNQPH